MPNLRPRVYGGDATINGRIPVSAGREQDSTLTAITKWIPVEVIAFYEALTTPFGAGLRVALWYVILIGMAVTALWIAFATESSSTRGKIAWRQIILSVFAFLAWVVGTTSPDIWKAKYQWWQPSMNSAVLAIGAICLPIIDGMLRRLRVPQD